MAAKLIIVFLVNAVTANDFAQSNTVPIPSLISPENPYLVTQHAENTFYNNQIPENHYDSLIELQMEEPTPCQSTAVFVPILNQLLNLLMQDPSHVNKVSRISALLQEYLNNMPEVHKNDMKLANGENEVKKDTLRTAFSNGHKTHVKTKIVFKYELPSINQPSCKDVFMRLIKSAYDVYVQLAKNPMCKNSDILEAILKNPEPLNDYSNSLNPSFPTKKDEYSIYDLFKPHTPEKDNIGSFQVPINVNDLTNIYGNYKPIQLHGTSPLNPIKTDTKSTLVSDKLIPNSYYPKFYEYGKNVAAFQPNYMNYNRPANRPKNSLNDGNYLNVYEIYNTNDENENNMPQKEKSNILFPSLNNLKMPENGWRPHANIGTNHVNGKNVNPIDSIVSILTAATVPDEKNKIEGKDMTTTYLQNNPNMNHNGVPNGQNVYYHYLPSQSNYYQHGTTVNPTNQIPIQQLHLNIPYQKDVTQYNPADKYITNQYGVPNKINNVKPSLQNVHNNDYLNKLDLVSNMQQIDGVSNVIKFDPTVNTGVIEFTFAVKRATPLIYQPLYFVKFKIPYSSFLHNIRNLLLTKPNLKFKPLKVYQELIALSNVSDISPGLKGYKKEDILRLAYKNGELVTAKLVKDDNALNEQLRLMQSLNSGIGAADILKLMGKNNDILNTSFGNDNSSDNNFGVSRYGKVMTPYYDLTTSGIGVNTEPISGYESKQELSTNIPVHPVTFGSFGSNVIQPQQYPSGLASPKSTLGQLSLGING